jgi:hypothetical protein
LLLDVSGERGLGVKRDRVLQRFVVSAAGAMISFCVVAVGVYYKVADVKVNGAFHGGPASLAAAMAGLFGGGVVAVLVLVFLLRWGSSRELSREENVDAGRFL